MSELLPKPPFASYIWSDATHIYLELPCPVGRAPHICAYAKTEGGLAKALAAITQLSNKDRLPPPPGYFRHGEAKPPVSRPKPALSGDLALAAKRVLRRMGMV